MSTITKLSPNMTQYYKNITSPIGAIVRIQRDIQVCAVQRSPTSYKRKTQETSRGPRRVGSWTGLSLIHYASATPLWLTTGRIHKLQTLGSQHEDPRESELHNEWWFECQMACVDRHMCIDKSKLNDMHWKSCREHRHTIHEREISIELRVNKSIG